MLLKSPPPSMQMEWEVQQMRREYEAQFPPNPFEHVGEGYEAHAPLPIAHMEVRDPCDDIIGNSFHDDPFGGNPFDNPFSANPFDDPFNYDPFNYVPHPDDDVTDEDNGGKSTQSLVVEMTPHMCLGMCLKPIGTVDSFAQKSEIARTVCQAVTAMATSAAYFASLLKRLMILLILFWRRIGSVSASTAAMMSNFV